MAIAEVDNCIDSGIDSCADTSSDAKTPNITIQRPDTASDAQTPKITIHRIDTPHEKKSGITRTTTQKPDGKITLETIQTQDIEKIIRMIKKKKSVRYISEQMGMEEDFAEQICRLYLTHPGVTAEGIMTKMGL